MAPSLGRTVIYRCKQGESYNGARIHPAVVTSVHSDECVNLMVLPDCGAPFAATSVMIDTESTGEEGEPYRWFWPPRA